MADTTPKPFVFVLMPFSPEFDDTYKLGIKPACESAGAYAERVDEQIFQESILQRTYNQISKADIIVSEMTGKNPNVFYETGYAHALGKNVILVTKTAADIPFDLKHYPHIVYEGKIVKLNTELEKKVRWWIENLTAPRSMPEPDVRFYLSKTPLLDNPRVEIGVGSPGLPAVLGLIFNVQNSTERRIERAYFQILFITSEHLRSAHRGKNRLRTIIPPGGGHIHVFDEGFTILPGAWEQFEVIFNLDRHPTVGQEEEIVLRMLTDSGGMDYPFRIVFVE